MYKILQVLRRLIDAEKFRSRASKDDPIELRSPVTKDDIIAEVWFFVLYVLFVWGQLYASLPTNRCLLLYPKSLFLLPQLTYHSSSLPPILF
jgi:hypothetical protein